MSKTYTFEENYVDSVMSLQPEYYSEVKNVTDQQLRHFQNNYGKKPHLLDIGSAGLMPFDLQLAESITILDLFTCPKDVNLPAKVNWNVGNILDETSLKNLPKFDIINLSSLLHHLCDSRNNSTKNLYKCFANIRKLLEPNGQILVFESTCSSLIAKTQDLLYPIYSRILINVFKFTYIRMVSKKEITRSFLQAGLKCKELPFKQPQYIAQGGKFSVPTKIYPLTITCFKGHH